MSRLAFMILSLGLIFGVAAPMAAIAATPPNAASDSALQSQRATKALNILEANGYGDFKNFRADGKDFAATVTSAGHTFPVMVDPDSNKVARQS